MSQSCSSYRFGGHVIVRVKQPGAITLWRASPRVAENAVQLHGGIGSIWEYGLHLRRAARLIPQFRLPGADQKMPAQLALHPAGITAAA